MAVIAPLLSGGLAAAVIDAWKPFAAHANGCERCQMAISVLKGAPNDPFPRYDECCEEGQTHFVLWMDAKIVLVARLQLLTAPWGMAGLAGEEADERSDAIVAMPGPAAAELFREPDAERREAMIGAMIVALRNGGVRTSREREEERRQCAWVNCDTGPYRTRGDFAVRADRPRQRYCCERCRTADRRERPRLMSTEE